MSVLLLFFSKREGFPWSLLLQRCLCIKFNWLPQQKEPMVQTFYVLKVWLPDKTGICQIWQMPGKFLHYTVQVALLQARWSRFLPEWSRCRQQRRQRGQWRRDEHQDASNVRAWRTRSGEGPHLLLIFVWNHKTLILSKCWQDFPFLTVIRRHDFFIQGSIPSL